MISITVDTSPITDYLTNLQKEDQIQFAVSKSLNDLARSIQSRIRDNMRQSFTLRKTQWVLNRIYISTVDKATKTKWSTVISVNEPYNILAKFEEGGEKVSVGGHRYLAVPNAKSFGKATPPDELRIKNLNLKAIGNEMKGNNETFLIHSKRTGVPLILQDVWNQKGKKRKGINKWTLNRILYTLVPKVRIPAKLNFVATAQSVIASEAIGIFEKNVNLAIQTARK